MRQALPEIHRVVEEEINNSSKIKKRRHCVGAFFYWDKWSLFDLTLIYCYRIYSFIFSLKRYMEIFIVFKKINK